MVPSKFKSVLTAIAILALLPALSVADNKSAPAPLVVVAPVIEKPARPHSTIAGTVIPLLEATVASRVAGFVINTTVEVGNMVENGADLVVVESLTTQRKKQIQQTIIAEAKAHLDQAKNNLARDQKLRHTPALSRQRLADRQAEVAIRTAILNRAIAQQKQIDDQLSWHKITAPFAGIITKKSVHPGEWIKEGQGVVTLLDPSQLEIKAQIPANIANHLTPGMLAQAYFSEDGKEEAVTLRAILPRQNPTSRNRPSFWRINNPAATIAGQEVSLTIPLGEMTTMVLVLKDAVIRKGKKTHVFIVDNDTISLSPIQLGPSVENYFQVYKGLQAGEQVVVRGNERVHPGQKVKPVQLTGPVTTVRGQEP